MGSFKTLLPLLPQDVHYLCVDLAGHGTPPRPPAMGVCALWCAVFTRVLG